MRMRLSVAVVACLALAGVYVALSAEPPPDAEYVGTSKCRLCHLDEYKTWKDTKHATNFETLIGDERSDPDCVECHTTGYGKPGGFVNEDETPKLTNVGCEECHGPGSAHAEAAKDAPDTGEWEKFIENTPRAVCTNCHNPHVNQKARVEALRAGG